MAAKYLFYTALLVMGMAIGSPNIRPPNVGISEQAEIQPPVKSVPKYQAGKDSALAIGMEGGSCSGSLYGDSHHVILTAMHCVKLGGPVVSVNGQPVTTQVMSTDGNDHIFVHVDQYISGRPARIAAMPAAGAEVYVWGNPDDFRNLLRIGHVAGRYRLDGQVYDVFDLNTWHGDSGGGMFDANGNIVAVVLGIRYEDGEGGWDMAIAEPFAFTPAQLHEAERG